MADVTFTFKGDIADLKRALSDIKGEVSKTKEAVSSVAASMTTAFAAVAGAVAAVKGAFDFISNIPAQAARFEDFHVVLSQIMGDTEKAGNLLKNLWKDAANGNVALEGMVAAAKPLATVFDDAGKIREWTNRFADISSGSGIAADVLAKVYARMIQIGTVDTRPLEQLGKQSVPIYEELARVVGTTGDKILDMVKSGSVSVGQFEQALRNLTDEGGKFYNLSAQLSNTTAGSWSTMMESFNLLAAELGQPINDTIRPILQDIGAWLQSIMPQVRRFGESVASVFSAIGAGASAVNSALSPLVGSMGAVKVALGAAVAGLLVYISRTQKATASTLTFGESFKALRARINGVTLAGLAASIKTSLAGINRNVNAALVGIKMTWNITWTSLVAVTKASMVAIKAAIVSTGVGLIVVGIAEGLAAIYSWFMKNKEAAEQASDSWDRFFDRQKELKEMEKGVKTKDDKDAYMSALENQISELRKERRDAASEGYDELVRSLDTQIASLERKKKAMDSILDKEINYHTQVERANAALKAREAELKAIEEKQEATRAKMEGLRKKQMEADKEAYFSGFEGEQQIQVRLKAIGFESIGALKYEIDRLTTWGTRDEEEAEKYEAMIASYNKIIALRKEIDEGEKRSKEEDERKKKALEEQRAEYDMRLKILEAEAAHDKERVAQLEAEQRLLQLTAEYRKAGFADAEAMARREVAAENAAEEARNDDEKEQQGSRMPASWIQSSKAAVGGGGRSYLVGGDAMLSEQKKHTKSLDRLVALGEKPKPIEVKVDTVIGK